MTRPRNRNFRLAHGAWFALPLSLALLAGCEQKPQSAVPAPPLPTAPLAQDTPPPDYPAEYACRQVGGTAVLNVALAANGYPVKVDVQQSSGTKALDDLAVAAVREWKFRPATVRGRPVTSRLQVPVKFTPPNPPPDECNRHL